MPSSSNLPEALDGKPSLEPLRGRRVWKSATVALIASNLLVGVAMLAFGATWSHSSSSVQLAWGANFGPATKDGEWWRLGTAMFLHFGVWHLATNMVALWESGRLVEALFGPRRFLVVYLASGLTGNLFSLIAQGDRAVSGGASGAIFGVYGALLVFLLQERRRLHPGDFKWLFWGAAAFSGIMFALGFVVPGIDNAAHAGGLVAGVLVGLVQFPRPVSTGSVGRWLAGLAFSVMVVSLVANIPEPRYRWSEEELARSEIRSFLADDAKINARLRDILAGGRAAGISFDQLAGKIEADVVKPYEHSFEQLSEVQVSPSVPSAATLENLRRYAESRRNASQALVEGLRTQRTK